jgi:hypothetical protein
MVRNVESLASGKPFVCYRLKENLSTLLSDTKKKPKKVTEKKTVEKKGASLNKKNYRNCN